MAQPLEVSFPGGKRVDVKAGDFNIATDQAVKNGGDASAPEPFTLFLASIAACGGIYALNFCQSRDIPTDGLGLSMDWERDPQDPLKTLARLRLRLPAGFPQQYRDSIVRAIDLCAVKKHILQPPTFEVLIED
jgi:putative redox protein